MTWSRALAAAAVAAVVSGASTSACTGTIGGRPGEGLVPGSDDAVIAQTEPAPGGVRRLIARQYVGSVEVLFGEAAAAAAAPPPDAQLHGLEVIGASELALPDTAVAAYEESARLIAAAVVQDASKLAELLPCSPTGPDDDTCHRAFVETTGRLAWRRPLTNGEVDLLTQLAQSSANNPDVNDFDAGIEDVIAALLQAPYFTYMVELGHEDGDAKRFLTDHELVTRMAFFLLDRTPDASLLDVADQGGLETLEDVRALAASMLERDAARQATRGFYGELYRLREVSEVNKDANLFPQFSEALAASMTEETLRFIEDVVWTRDADARELFTADYTFVDSELASLYGVASPSGGGFDKVTLPSKQQRAGLLGHASWLTRFAHPANTSATRRGLFVRTALLCDAVPPPPPGVDTQLSSTGDGAPKTAKQKLEKHQEDPSCAGCHLLMDDIGFALEHYDAVGAYRDKDNGLAIDSSADVDDLGAFASAADLGDILADDPRSMTCLIRNLFRSSMGHLETDGEAPSLDALEEAFAESGYSVQDLLIEIVASPAFRMVGAPK